MNHLPEAVHRIVQNGYDRSYTPGVRGEQFERIRNLARKWRNLVSEAQFDIPNCLHAYIDWTMPESWDLAKPQRIHTHDFLIKLPGFKPVAVIYTSLGMGDWLFNRFEIISGHKNAVSSNKYDDLPLFLAMARELNRPQKQKIVVEEISGDLADNAKLIKVSEVKQVKKESKDCYILTARDFVNNPDADHPYSDMPIYA